MVDQAGATAQLQRWLVPALLFLCGYGLVLSASASAQKVQPVRSFEVDAYESAHGLQRPDAERALTLQHLAAGIVEQLEYAERGSYAGVWFDNKTSKFVVPIADPKVVGAVRRLLSASRLNDDYRLDPVQETWNELLAVQDRLDDALRDEIEANFVETSLDPRRNIVVIDVAAGLSSGSEDKIDRAARQSGGHVAIERHRQDKFQAEPAACTTWSPPGDISHRICDRPLRGGVFIEGINESNWIAECSAGFAAIGRLLGNHFLLTAGHCVQGYGHWRSEDAAHGTHYIGQVEAGMFPGRDYAAIRVKPAEPGNENYWEGGSEGWVSRVVYWGGSQNLPIEYEAASYVGEQVCRSGTRTGSTCGSVVALNKTANYPEGTVYNLTEAAVFADQGDSGGSVWAGSTALGLLSGTTGTGNSLFQEVTEATDGMQVTVGARLPAPPWAETKPAGPVSGREVTLQGEVDTAATGSNYHFEYGTTTSYGSSTSSGYVSAEAGHNPIGVSQSAQGLAPITEYHYRIVAENSAGSFAGKDRTFKTTTASPLARPTAVSGRSQSSAALKGEVESGGAETTYQFEYGETTAYGSVSLSHTVAAGTGWYSVEGFASGLRPETTYHYRLKATNANGTTYSSDATFSTLAKPATYLSSFGTAGTGGGQFNRPMGLAVDPAGNVYVVDKENARVEKFNAKGEYLSAFGSTGAGSGQFKEPRSIAIDPASGNLFVADYGNARVQEFSPAGSYLATVGVGTLSLPYGVAVDTEGRLWVSDLSNKVVAFKESAGTWQSTGSWSSVEGSPMLSPAGLAVDQQGDVWVAEFGSNRLLEFEEGNNGKLTPRVRLASTGSAQGQISEPVDIEVKPSGSLLVVERGNSRVQQFSPRGEYQAVFGAKGIGAGQFTEPTAIGLADGGVVVVSDSGNNRIQRWSQPVKPEAITQAPASVTTGGATLKGLVNPGALATTYRFEYGPTASYGTSVPVPNGSAGSGVERVSESQAVSLQPEKTYHYRIVAFNAEGTVYGADQRFTTPAKPATYLSSFGTAGTANGQFKRPLGMAVDASNNIYVVDKENNRIQKFNAKGEYQSQFGSGKLSEPRCIAIDPNGNFWVTDDGNHRIAEFNPQGEYVRSIGPGEGAGGSNPLDQPYGIAIGSDGRMWVGDPGRNALVEFKEAAGGTYSYYGELLKLEASGGVTLSSPAGVALDPSGNVWIAEAAANRVSVLEKVGGGYNPQNSRIAFVSGGVLLNFPTDIQAKPSGNLVVASRANNQVVQFSPAGEVQMQFGTKGTGAGQFTEPSDIALGQGGVIYVSDSGNNRVQRWQTE